MNQHLIGTWRLIRLRCRSSVVTLTSWVAGLLTLAIMTAATLKATYATPQELQTYADSLGSGEAVAALNGRIAGLNTFGGVFANEFAFVANFAIPLCAITLIGRFTRKDEETGRAELLYSGPVGRYAPLASAWLITSTVLATICLGVFLTLIAWSVPDAAAAWHAASLWFLGLVFAALASIAAQIFDSSRAVLGASLALVLTSLGIRALGATDKPSHRAEWFAPHGWTDRVQAFGTPNALPLALSCAVTFGLLVIGVVLRSRRDVGQALFTTLPGNPRATAWLSSPLGLALRLRRSLILGWTLGVGAFMLLYGALTEIVREAVLGNPELAEMYATEGSPDVLDGLLSMFVMVFALLCGGFAIASTGPMRSAEVTGVLETQLAGPCSRRSWWVAQVVTSLMAVMTVGGVGAFSLAGGVVLSTGDSALAVKTLTGTLWQAAPIILFFALGVAATSIRRAWLPLIWTTFAFSSIAGVMGPMLKIPDSILDASPFLAVGQVPAEAGSISAIGLTLGLASALCAISMWRFLRRDITSD